MDCVWSLSATSVETAVDEALERARVVDTEHGLHRPRQGAVEVPARAGLADALHDAGLQQRARRGADRRLAHAERVGDLGERLDGRVAEEEPAGHAAGHAGAAHLFVEQAELLHEQPLLARSLSFVQQSPRPPPDVRQQRKLQSERRARNPRADQRRVAATCPARRSPSAAASSRTRSTSEPARGDAGLAVDRSGQGAGHGADRVGVVAEVHGQHDGVLERRACATPPTGRCAACRARRPSSGPPPARPRRASRSVALTRLSSSSSVAAISGSRSRSSPASAAAIRSLKATQAQPARRSKCVSVDSRCELRAARLRVERVAQADGRAAHEAAVAGRRTAEDLEGAPRGQVPVRARAVAEQHRAHREAHVARAGSRTSRRSGA